MIPHERYYRSNILGTTGLAVVVSGGAASVGSSSILGSFAVEVAVVPHGRYYCVN